MFEALILTACAIFAPVRYLRRRAARDDAAAALERIRMEPAGAAEPAVDRRRPVKATEA